MKQVNAKVAIIGGGLAGIYTAYLLQKNGISFELLEAKPCLGGRIYGEATQSDNYKIDLGPSWIFPHQHKIQQLVTKLGLTLIEQFNQGDAIFQRNLHENPEQISGVAPPDMYRIAGGTTQLIQTLAQGLSNKHITLGKTVSKLEFDGKYWQVYSNSTQAQDRIASLQFEHLVIAIPPRIAVEFLSFNHAYAGKDFLPKKPHIDTATNKSADRSELPHRAKTNSSALKQLLNKFANTPTWMAAQAKFAITYKTPFWRERGLSGQAFSHVGPMVEIHDASHDDNSGKSVYALFGFIGVAYRQRQHVTHETMKKACVSQLISLFGKEAGEYHQTYLKDWGSDSFTASAQDQTQASSHPHIELASEQAWLTHIKLHLATSEFAHSEAGYMEGAIIAAESAFEQIMSDKV